MNIAIIPARGGSKRIPRKNIRPFAGRPMMEWPVTTALKSGLFEHVLVSTDDQEIANVARAAGAEVPFVRPADISDDHSSTTDVVVHAIEWAQEAGWELDAACCIYATAAFVSRDDLEATREMLSSDCDFSFAAVRYGHPPQRGFTRASNGAPLPLNPEYESTRTQDLPAVYHDAGQFYWGLRNAWLERRPFFGKRTKFLELPAVRAHDMDTMDDWELGELLFTGGTGCPE